uniref:Fibronectin type-III domain-containing protein n=1 Tax=Daphnia galeata TaxID=27404 RepID=A0A8J2RRB6_9CRUS|nr:unnamed protein product [Daphnia galeata]
MKHYVDSYTKLWWVERDNDEKVPWHMIQRKRKQVLAKIRELTDHVEKNKHLTDQAGNLLKDNLGRLPGPLTNLRIADIQKTSNPSKKNSRSSTIRLEWDYEDLGFPCSFMVEYQLNSDESWAQKKTIKPSGENHLKVNLKNGSVAKFRVAADTCIDRSEFSKVIDAEEPISADEDDATISDKESEC